MNSGGELSWHVGVYKRYERERRKRGVCGKHCRTADGGIRQNVVKLKENTHT